MPPTDSIRRSPKVEQAIGEIANTIRAHASGGKTATVASSRWPAPAKLRDAVHLVKSSQEAVGQMPPEPPTLRGRIGAWAIRQIRRALFWYTARIHEFHRNVARALELQVEAADELRGQNRELDLRAGKLENALSAGESGLREDIASLERKILAANEAQVALRTEVRWLQELTADLRDRQARTATLLERYPMQIRSQPVGRGDAVLEKADQRFDELYMALEERFRGERTEIKDRLRVYLPILQSHGIGTPGMPLFDIGCGRGEWLELLAENGLEGRGVDLSRRMVARCLESNLPVMEGDAVACLRAMPPNSIGGVSGFHIVEHLPFEYLVDLLDETVRVLKPGGVAIFETPNPANLLMGTERFYFDPTHRNPLPSLLMQFLVEQRGLTAVEILELQLMPDTFRLPSDGSVTVDRLNQLLYGAQDYAIIGWKSLS